MFFKLILANYISIKCLNAIKFDTSTQNVLQCVNNVQGVIMQVYTVRDLVEMLKIDRRQIYKMIKDNAFPQPLIFTHKSTGNHKFRWLRKDVDNWLESKRV